MAKVIGLIQIKGGTGRSTTGELIERLVQKNPD